ncbi:MAG TPA: hypothetical protein VL860_14895, partial [Planctomycetota bacterium]|nr:hypothetical protein [Planctomycetota bacterium]
MGFINPKEQEKPETGPTMRKPGDADIWQISHAMAYFVLPHFAFKSLQKMIDLWIQSPRTCPTFFYLTTCQLKKAESVTEEATKFHAHTGKLTEKYDFYMMEHPKPPPVDLSNLTPEQLAVVGPKTVLAPYFSVAAVERTTKAVQYFVLGQAPIG